jgi:hypothetical protein
MRLRSPNRKLRLRRARGWLHSARARSIENGSHRKRHFRIATSRVTQFCDQAHTADALLKLIRLGLHHPFARNDFWFHRRRATSDDPLRASNLTTCAPRLARTLPCYATNLSDDSPSRTSYPARNSAPSAPGYACRPARETSRSTACPSRFPLRSCHRLPP